MMFIRVIFEFEMGRLLNSNSCNVNNPSEIGHTAVPSLSPWKPLKFFVISIQLIITDGRLLFNDFFMVRSEGFWINAKETTSNLFSRVYYRVYISH